MLTREEAHEIAWKEIKKPSYFELVILDEFTREEEFGWMFFYTFEGICRNGRYSTLCLR